MIWNEDRIQRALRVAYRAGVDLSYNHMTHTHQSLVSAAAYRFGSYRNAIQSAGLNYAKIMRRPRWTREAIVKLIKAAKARKQDLHWSAVTKRKDPLGRASFAAIQPRLFGTWARALKAAGVDPLSVCRYRDWKAKDIVVALRKRQAAGKPMNSGAVQSADGGLHAAAMRYFKSFDNALRAAKIDPDKTRLRQRWNRAKVLETIRKTHRQGQSLSGAAIRKHNLPLHGAAVRFFGSFIIARKAAGVKWKMAKKE